MDIATARNIFAGFVTKSAPPMPGGPDGRNRDYGYRYESAFFSRLSGAAASMPAVGHIRTRYSIVASGVRVNAARLFPARHVCAVTPHLYSGSHLDFIRGFTQSRLLDGVPAEGDTFDYNPIARRLGQAVAFYTSPAAQGRVSPDWLLADQPLNLTEVRGTGRAYGASGVYVPVHSTKRADVELAGVLLYAAAGCGADVYTNEVYVEGGHWATRLPTGVALIDACFRAAQYVIDSAAMSSAGLECLLQFICGMHDVVSVEAHTDEGGVCRDIMRAVPYGIPQGVLGGSPAQHVVLPGLTGGLGKRVSSYASLVHSMVLASAALFAVSDPGARPGSTLPVTSVRAPGGSWHDHHGILVSSAGDVGSTLAHKLGVGCGLYEDTSSIAGLFRHAANALFDADTQRHLDHDVIHPWYWIEPAPILAGCEPSVQESFVCPPLCKTYGVEEELPLWADDAAVDVFPSYVEVTGVWKAPRRCGWWYLYSPNASAQDGASAVEITDSVGYSRTEGADALRSEVLSPGFGPAGVAPNSLLSTCWVVGASGVPPPAMACPTTQVAFNLRYAVRYYDTAARLGSSNVALRFPAGDGKVHIKLTQLTPTTERRNVSTSRSFDGNRGVVRATQLFSMNAIGADVETSSFEARLKRMAVMTDRTNIDITTGEESLPICGTVQTVVDSARGDVLPRAVVPGIVQARAGLHQGGGRAAPVPVQVSGAAAPAGETGETEAAITAVSVPTGADTTDLGGNSQ